MVDTRSRTNCKKCRLEKCHRIGMRPEKVDRGARRQGRVGGTCCVPVHASQETEGDEVRVEVSGLSAHVVDGGSRNRPSFESLPSDLGPSESYESNEIVDIDSLVDDCFLEPAAKIVFTYKKNATNSKIPPKDVFELLSEDDEAVETPKPHTAVLKEPIMDLTFEEEFKIYELIVRKDSLVDAEFCLVSEIPQIRILLLKFLSSGGLCRNRTSENIELKYFKDGFETLKHVVDVNLNLGGKIRACLDMFDEYKHVDENVKYETFEFSLKIFHICSR